MTPFKAVVYCGPLSVARAAFALPVLPVARPDYSAYRVDEPALYRVVLSPESEPEFVR